MNTKNDTVISKLSIIAIFLDCISFDVELKLSSYDRPVDS